MSAFDLKRVKTTPFVLFVILGIAASAHAEPSIEAITVYSPKRDEQVPQQSQAAINALQVARSVNALDVEDTLKYLPSLFVRKRNYGDTQPVLATRTWGVNASARSLVYADGVLLTALIANNNTIGAPRWGLVSADDVERAEVLYGPFAARDPGNALGAVVRFTTRIPKGFETSVKQDEAFQSFSAYGLSDTFRTDKTQAAIADRWGAFWLKVSGEHAFSQAQPLTYATTAGVPAGTTGMIPSLNKLGQIANVAGSTGLLDTDMDNVNLAVGYDGTIRAVYRFGLWQNDGVSRVASLLKDRNGQPTYGGLSAFASGSYFIQERHSAHSLKLAADPNERFGLEIIVSHYRFDQDDQQTALSAGAGLTLNPAGRVTQYGGTNWTNGDLVATWRLGDGVNTRNHEANTRHELSFGIHSDVFHLENATLNIANWADGANFVATGPFSAARGTSSTTAFWFQDAVQVSSEVEAILGGRFESWNAYEGVNAQIAGANLVSVNQPKISRQTFSPKASVIWTPDLSWRVRGAFGKASRFPTVGELYQLVTTGATLTSPNPNLAPESALSEEVAVERTFENALVRTSFFWENTRNALIAQTSPLVAADGSLANVSYVQNVGEVRNRGIEVALDGRDLVIEGLDVSASVTYVDSAILRDDNVRSSLNPALTVDVRGKRAPNVPDWRASLSATYQIDDRLSAGFGLRISRQIYSTLDNADRVSNVYQSFNPYTVADLKLHYALSERLALAVGIDNLADARYFEFHPFPGRTVIASLKVGY